MSDAPVVLILKPSSLGDIVHTLPGVARFRAARPGWRVRWLVNTEFAPLLEGNPAVDEIVRFPRASFRGAGGAGRLWRWLRSEWLRRRDAERPELALDFQGLLRTALLGRLSGARALHGLADAREGATLFYNRSVPAPCGPVHAVRRYLALVDDLLPTASGGRPIEFPLPPGEPWPEALPEGGFIVLHPFARGAGKSLTAGQVEAFCRELAPRPVLVVGRGGEPLGALPGNAWNLLDRTSLAQLLWLLRRAAFVLSVDSGPSHLAAAALADPGRLAAIHAWTDPRRVGPFPSRSWVWKGGRLCRVGELATADAGEEAPGRSSRLGDTLGERDIQSLCALAGGASGPG